MTDSAVSYVIQKLVDLLHHEAHLFQGVRGQFEGLQTELKRMQCFLKDADTKQDDERVHNWVSEIREVAYVVEALIDTFILKVKYRNSRSFVKRYASIFKYWSDIHKVGKDIESIQIKIQDISKSRETYGIRNIGEGMSSASSERLRDLRQSSPHGFGKDIVGFEEDTAKLVAQLVKNDDQSPVISIVGMGGLGKTTLAKKVYNHSDVGFHFDCCAWVYVSQDCRTIDILQEILRQTITRPIEELQNRQEEELEAILYQALETKRFLVVLDDIWTKEAWDCLARAFLLSDGSRLLLTSRNREVALYADARSIPYELRPLSKEDSWELFCRKALIFMDNTVDTSCPPGLEDVGRKIVAKCGGLPLAIILIGGLLSRRNQLPCEWESVLGNLRSHFAGDQAGASAILDLSYNDLPYYLKSCFLYTAHFPEDYVIKVRKLLQLWTAEGLIPQQGERMESTAKDCLNELIHRNMFQAVKLSVVGRVKECRIHDLLRELSISKAKEEIFLEIYGNRDLSRQDKTRHLAVHFDAGMFLKSPPSTRRLRSLIVFQFASHYSNPRIEIEIICTSFQLLRVLDLENGRMEHLPREIGKLINLRYLGLRNTGINVLPLSMRYLQSLQTLDISDVVFNEIPNVISKLENLQHLHMSWKRMIVGQMKIDTLRHLQTVSGMNVLFWKGNNSKMLSNMWKLSVEVNAGSTVDYLLEFFNSIADLENLSSLHIQSHTDFSQFPLSSLHRLTKLRIDASHIPRQRSTHEFPQNLFQLTLSGFLLGQIEMEVLGNLPKLSILRLRRCRLDQYQLIFFANGFPQLNLLVLDSLHGMQVLKVEEGAMPRLRRFRISNCTRLISFHVRFVSDLQELELEDMPRSVENLLRERDSYEVFRILSVIFTNTGESADSETTL